MQIKNKVLTQEEYELQMNKMLEQYTSPDQLKAVAKDMYSDTYFMVPPDVEAASDDMRPNCFMWDAERGEFGNPPRPLGVWAKYYYLEEYKGDVPDKDLNWQILENLNKSDFKESEHPRDRDGKFSDKGGGGSTSNKPNNVQDEVKDAYAHYKKWKQILPDPVMRYIGHDSSTITRADILDRFEVNKELRTKQESQYRQIEYRHVGEVFDALELATTKYAYELPEPLTVYRGISGSYASKVTKKNKLTDNGFIYVTTDKRMAERYARKSGTLIAITLPKGTKCALGLEDQSEIILPRGQAFELERDSSGDLIGKMITHA